MRTRTDDNYIANDLSSAHDKEIQNIALNAQFWRTETETNGR